MRRPGLIEIGGYHPTLGTGTTPGVQINGTDRGTRTAPRSPAQTETPQANPIPSQMPPPSLTNPPSTAGSFREITLPETVIDDVPVPREPDVSHPKALEQALGAGHLEGGDLAQFGKGLYNGLASWLGLP